MAYQKPVIASNAGGISEWCDNNKSGFLVEPGNAGELTKKINLLLDNRELSIQMGLKGRDTVEKKLLGCEHPLFGYFVQLQNRQYSEASHRGCINHRC